MSQQVTINSVTANTPVDIYYCDAMSASCVYVSTVSVFPYTFDVPESYSQENIVVKIIDTQGCIDGNIIPITPTPTPSITPSITPSQTLTPTNTNTPSQTPTNTSTPNETPTQTPTFTPSPTATPVVVLHLSGSSCVSILSVSGYYTYISEANNVPVIGATLYQTLVNGVLYNPFNGGNGTYIMDFGGNRYQVQVNSTGQIINFISC